MRANGFTLIEMLIVIAILGVLMVFLWSAYSQTRIAAQNGEVRVDMLQNAVRYYTTMQECFETILPSMPITASYEALHFSRIYDDRKIDVSITNKNSEVRMACYESGEAEPFKNESWIAETTFRFFNGREWTDQWNSPQLPILVSLSFSSLPKNGIRSDAYQLTIRLTDEEEIKKSDPVMMFSEEQPL